MAEILTSNQAPQKSYHSAHRGGLAGDIFTFLVAMLWFAEVEVVGRLFIIEILFLFIALYVLASRAKRKTLPPFIKQILPLLGLWLLAQIITDVYRASPFEDYARGWAKIFFFGSNIVAIYVLTKGMERRLLLFMAGFAIGELLGIIWFPNVYFEGGMIWKFGYAVPVATLAILVTMKLGSRVLSVLVLIGLSAVNLLLDFRSLAGFCAGAAILTSYAGVASSPGEIARKYRTGGSTFLKRLAWIGMATILVISFVRLYQSAESIDLGALVSEGSRYGIERNPLYGRIETLVGLKAAMDSPLIGHGSWAKDIEYAVLAQAMAIDIGKVTGPLMDDLIPSHSYLIGAWVEAGIVGAFFWLFIFLHSVKAVKRAVNVTPHLISIISFLLLTFLWAVLFSPFGAAGRITAALSIVIVNFVLNRATLAGR